MTEKISKFDFGKGWHKFANVLPAKVWILCSGFFPQLKHMHVGNWLF